MLSARVNNILESGRKLFPQNQYGYGSWFKMPGTKIAPADMHRPSELTLSGNVGREKRNDRYYPGFDCIEASHWLKEQLQNEGLNPRYAWVQSPLHTRDVGIELSGELLSLTPNINPGSPFVGIKSILPDQAIENTWDSRSFPVLNDLTCVPLSSETIEGLSLRHAIIAVIRGNNLEISVNSNLIDEGFPIKGAETSFLTPLSNLPAVAESAEKGDKRKVLSMFQTKHFPVHMTLLEWANRRFFVTKFHHLPKSLTPRSANRREKSILRERNAELAYEFLPLISSLFDRQWTNIYAK